MRRLAATVLTFEALVVFFASLVAAQLSNLSPTAALGGGGALALSCLVVAGLLRFGRVAYGLGSALQLAVIATGLVVPVMFFLGAVFAALWVAALRVGSRLQTG
jgi:hypothetical protein